MRPAGPPRRCGRGGRCGSGSSGISGAGTRTYGVGTGGGCVCSTRGHVGVWQGGGNQGSISAAGCSGRVTDVGGQVTRPRGCQAPTRADIIPCQSRPCLPAHGEPVHLQLGPLRLHVSHTRATSADVKMSQCPHIWDETHTTPHTHTTHTYTHTQRHAAVNGLTPPLCRSNLSMPTLRVIFPGRGGGEVLRGPHVQYDGGRPAE